MTHRSKLILTVVFLGCLALIAGFVAAQPVVAQDAPEDTVGQPAKEIPDSVKEALQESAPSASPAATEETGDMQGETQAEDQPAEAEMTEEEPQAEPSAEEETMAEAEPEDPTAPYKNIEFQEGEKPQIVMETSMGTIVLELWPDVAPKHCQSFVYLTKKGFYDSLTFHRIVPGFVIQGGCPLGNGTGGPGYNVPAEFSNKPHEDGVLSMARANDPNSAGSQFFICLGRLKSLDNKYTVFGKVIEGLDVVHQIEKVPTQGERPKTPVVMTNVYVKEAESD